MGSTEQVWGGIFERSAAQYRPPTTLVLYDGAVRSACGLGQSAMGTFYCPQDEKLYVDLSFYRDLQTRFRAPGDFAQAYVIAHEVGHHVQKLTGGFRNARSNRDSVRLELQADCYAGVWGHYAKLMRQLDPGDVEEALNAAATTGCRCRRRGASCPSRSPTALRRSASPRSAAAWNRATRGPVPPEGSEAAKSRAQC